MSLPLPEGMPDLVTDGEIDYTKVDAFLKAESDRLDAIVAQPLPTPTDRLDALERLTLAIAKSDPKTALLAEVAAVETTQSYLADKIQESPS